MIPSPPTSIHRLGNGLTILVREEKAHPVASFQFWVETGSIHEKEWLGAGLSHLLEHMVFKGTRSYSGQELAQKVQERGGLWNAYTSTTRTVYYIDGPSSSWSEFLNFLTELVFFPTFPENELDKEKEVIRREMAMYDDDPDSVGYNLLISTLYKRHPRRWPVLGELNRFNLLQRPDMLAYHQARYVPNNVFIVVTGDVNTAEIVERIRTLTQELSARPLTPSPCPREPHQWGLRTAREEFATPSSKLSLIWRMPERNHPDSPALTLLSRILGGGRSAWLYREFHDESGIAYDITSSITLSEAEEGIFIIAADVERTKRDQLKKLILERVKTLSTSDFSQDITRIIRQIKASRLRNMASASGLAEEIAGQWLATRNLGYSDEWMQAIQRVTPADLQRVADTWFPETTLTEVSLDPTGTNTVTDSKNAPLQSGLESIYTLKNGLNITLRPDRRLPMTYACIVFKAGPPTETKETAGITSLMAECLLKGTTTRTCTDIAHYLEDLGGSIHASSGNNSIVLGFQVLSEDIASGFNLLSDLILNPTFPEDAFEKEREAVISELEEDDEDPVSVTFKNLRSATYGDTSYGNPTSGTIESIQALTPQHLHDHKQRLFCGQNASLCITGDFDEQIVKNLIEDTLGQVPSGTTPPLLHSTPQAPGEIRDLLDKEQSVLAVALPGINVHSEQNAEAILFQTWCSDMAGPIFTRIREEAGLAYFASSTLFIGLDTGNIIFYLGTSAEQLNQARAKLEETLAEIYKNGISPEELERTRAGALSARMLARQSNGALAQILALDRLYGLPANNFEIQEKRIATMTTDAINAFIRDRLAPDQPRTWSIVTKEK
ncbi:MAG: pitrilysin family protein [Akkermansia sp.]